MLMEVDVRGIPSWITARLGMDISNSDESGDLMTRTIAYARKKTKSVREGNHIVISERLSSVIRTITVTKNMCRTSRKSHDGNPFFYMFILQSC